MFQDELLGVRCTRSSAVFSGLRMVWSKIVRPAVIALLWGMLTYAALVRFERFSPFYADLLRRLLSTAVKVPPRQCLQALGVIVVGVQSTCSAVLQALNCLHWQLRML